MIVSADAWHGAVAVHDQSECPVCGRESCESDCVSNDPSPSAPPIQTASEDFIRTDRGTIVASSLHNIRLALARLGTTLTYDSFSRVALVDDVPLDDVSLDRLWVRIDDCCGFRPSKETLRTLIDVDARTSTAHPVHRYLHALQWDHTPRLDRWLTTYGGAPDTPYVRSVGAIPLIAAVRRVRRPGCKFDELLVVEGPQGTLKSSALRVLCPREDWFSDDLPLGVDSKLVIERTTAKWIIEASEMHGHRGRESETLKAFLSRQVDGPVRLAYGRLSTMVPRQFVIIGTTNRHVSYLKDETGARRFWPVTIERFDVEALARDRDQLWAEAASRETAGEPIRLQQDLWAAASEQQEARRAADPWEPILEPLFADRACVPVQLIWEELGMEASRLDNRHADRIAAIVQRHGFTRKKKIRVNGTPMTCWVRGDSADECRVPCGSEHRSQQKE